MPPRFQSTLHRRDEVTFLKVAGVLDEDNDLGELTERIGPGPLVVDLGDVERINSCGVRDWVNWLGRVEKAGASPVLVECSPPIVAQVNLVHNFVGGGVIKSFYAPYFCPRCEREKVLLLDARSAAGEKGFKPPLCRCDECDGPMDFDDMEDSYFAFLANSALVVSDARVEEVIQEFTPSDAGPKLRTRTASNPSFGPLGTGTGPGATTGSSNPSTPSFKRISGSHPAVAPSLRSGVHAAVLPEPAAPGPPPPTISGKALWIVVVALIGSALALAFYLFSTRPPIGG